MTGLLLLTGLAQAAEVHTCGSAGGDDCHPSLAEAVAAAEDGDTVLLAPGSYAESVTLEGRQLTLAAADGAHTALLTDPDGGETVLTLRGGEVVLEGLYFRLSETRAAVLEDGASLVIRSSRVRAGSVHGNGAALHAAAGTSLVVDQSVLTGGAATGDGGLIWSAGTSLEIVDSQLLEGRTAGDGGGVSFVPAEGDAHLEIEGSLFEDCQANGRGGALHVAAEAGFEPELDLRTSSFLDNEGGEGGALALEGVASARLSDTRLSGNHSDDGAGAVELAGQELALRGLVLCATASGLGVPALRVSEAESLDLHHSFLVENTGGGVALGELVSATLANNHLLGNLAPAAAAVQLEGEQAELLIRDNLVVGNVDHQSGEDPIQGEAHALQHNLYWENSPAPEEPEETAVLADPLLLSWTPDGSCEVATTAGEADEFWHGWGGGAHDSGSEADQDLDGSPLDIGAFGGSSAQEDPSWLDPDGDGVPTLLDCAPYEGDIAPGVEDPPYDGVDANCDGASDHDVDGDGQDATSSGGLDCDDEDPEIYSGAPELAYDGIDQNCDGTDLDDVDGDGYPATIDCDDEDGSVHPGAVDNDPLVDVDCDGWLDTSEPLAAVGCASSRAPPLHTWPLALLLVSLLGRRQRSTR